MILGNGWRSTVVERTTSLFYFIFNCLTLNSPQPHNICFCNIDELRNLPNFLSKLYRVVNYFCLSHANVTSWKALNSCSCFTFIDDSVISATNAEFWQNGNRLVQPKVILRKSRPARKANTFDSVEVRLTYYLYPGRNCILNYNENDT